MILEEPEEPSGTSAVHNLKRTFEVVLAPSAGQIWFISQLNLLNSEIKTRPEI